MDVYLSSSLWFLMRTSASENFQAAMPQFDLRCMQGRDPDMAACILVAGTIGSSVAEGLDAWRPLGYLRSHVSCDKRSQLFCHVVRVVEIFLLIDSNLRSRPRALAGPVEKPWALGI